MQWFKKNNSHGKNTSLHVKKDIILDRSPRVYDLKLP